MPVRFLRVLSTVFAVTIVLATGVAWTKINGFEDGIKHISTAALGGGGDDGAIDILLVGVDSRTDAHGNPLSAEELATLRAGDDVASSTDTIILIRIPNNGRSATAISIPRDSYVTAPGLGKMKINGVFGEVKLDTMKELIENEGMDPAEGEKRGIEAGREALIKTVAQLRAIQAKGEDALVAISGIGQKAAEEIAERLSDANIIENDRFLAAVRTPRSLTIFDDYDFLQNLPADATLEGFLFPDTYRFPVLAATPEQVIRPFLDNFEDRIGNKGLVGGGSGLSGRDLITLASIVEREAVQADERPIIAGVYINRLNNKCPEVGGPYLQADPTVQYARGTVGNWWWKPQSVEEYKFVQSPYNTYLSPGLPPGPIANPGQSAIEATRDPAQTGYCFFVATGDDGRHVFVQTYAEQQQNLQTYGYNP